MLLIQETAHDSPNYWEAIELRRQVLRIPLGLDFTTEQLSEESADTHFVALSGERVVGCLVMTQKSQGVVKMRQVAVVPELQGQGVGATIVAASESWAARNGYETIELSARDTAVPFYLKHGYEIVGEPFEEVSIPHRKMEKRIEGLFR